MAIKIIDDDKEIKIDNEKNVNIEKKKLNHYQKIETELKETNLNYLKNVDFYIYKARTDQYSLKEIVERFLNFSSVHKLWRNHIEKDFIRELFFRSEQYDDKNFEQHIIDLINMLLRKGYIKKYYYKDEKKIIHIHIGIDPTSCGFTSKEFRQFYDVNEEVLSIQDKLRLEYNGNKIVCDYCGSDNVRYVGDLDSPRVRINGVLKKLHGYKLKLYTCNDCKRSFEYYKQITLLEDGVYIEDDINKNYDENKDDINEGGENNE